MSYNNFLTRMRAGGTTARLEHIENGRRLLEDTFADDPSYISEGCPVWYSDKIVYPRIYGHSYKTTLPDTAEFQTRIDDPLCLGEIIPWGKDNGYWLCTSSINLHDVNWEGTLTLCNCYVKIKSPVDGTIRTYPVPMYNATQYGSGEYSEFVSVAKHREKIMTIGAEAHIILLMLDEHTLPIDNGFRFLIDYNNTNPTAYRVTQMDTSTYSNGQKPGYLRLYVVEDQLNRKTDDVENMVADMWEDPVGNNSEVHEESNDSWI